MALKLTLDAQNDLDDIYVEGVKLFGTAQAEKYSDALDDSLLLLATQPFMARERKEFGLNIRVHVHARHLIVYEVEQRDVLVLRILHQRRDWERELQ